MGNGKTVRNGQTQKPPDSRDIGSASERYLKSVFETAPVGIYQSTEERLLHVNPKLAAMFGYASASEMIGSVANLHDLFADPEQRRRLFEKAEKTTDFVRGEVEYIRKDGSRFTAVLRMRIGSDLTGRARCFENFVEDAAELRHAEKTAGAAMNYAQTLIGNSPVGIVTFRRSGETVSANPAVAAMVGGTVEEVCSKNFRQLDSWKRSGLYHAADGALRTGKMREVEVRHLSTFGKAAWFHVQFIPFDYMGEQQLMALFSDVTEHKRIEAELMESQEKLCQLAESIEGVFWIADCATGKILYASPRYEQIWGRSCESLYDRPHSFLEAIHPQDRQRIAEILARNGRGEEYDREYRIVRPDGSIRLIHDRAFLVKNERGETYRRAGIAMDITDKRHLEDQLRQAQKMEEIGRLASGVAHDFNNIISAMLMQLGLMRQTPRITAVADENLNELEGAAVRAAKLTRQLLLFSRRQAPRCEKLDLNGLIQNLLQMLRRLLGETININFHPSPLAAWVEADAGMLEQVLVNLCTNARDSMDKGGRLTLTTTLVDRGVESLIADSEGSEARAGKFLCVSVSDTGCGMDSKVMQHMFQPFFTTKETGKGTGLGLATAYRIVKQHQGWIEVISTPNKGSEFRVFLPAVREPIETTAIMAEADELAIGGNESVLLVEDEPVLRRSVALCLGKLGYQVFEASNGGDALKLWQNHKETIQLVLTDIVMPGQLSGIDLAIRLRDEKPALRVILSSGYTAELTGCESIESSATFLAKPYRLPTLALTVRQCLDDKLQEPEISEVIP